MNEKYKQEEIEELNLAGSEDGSDTGFESMKQEIATLRQMIVEKLENKPGQPKPAPKKEDDDTPTKKTKKKPTKKKEEEEEE